MINEHDQDTDTKKRFLSTSITSAFCKKIKTIINKSCKTTEEIIETSNASKDTQKEKEENEGDDDEEVISSLYHIKTTKSYLEHLNRTSTCSTFSSTTKSISTSNSTNFNSILDESSHSFDSTSDLKFLSTATSPSFQSITMDLNIDNDKKKIKSRSPMNNDSEDSECTSRSTNNHLPGYQFTYEKNLHDNDTFDYSEISSIESNQTIVPSFHMGINLNNNRQNKFHRKLDIDNSRSMTPLAFVFNCIQMD